MNKFILATSLVIGTFCVSPLAIIPAAAQSKTGIAVVNLQDALARSNAMASATQQIQETYRELIEQRNARAGTLQAEVDVLTARIDEENKKPTPDRALVETMAQERQSSVESAQQELNRISAPYELAAAYAQDQITVHLTNAVANTVKRLNIDLLLRPNTVISYEPHVLVTDAIIAELNVLVPTASITPPQGYRPGQLTEQAAAAARAAAAAAQPASQQPTTR